MTGRGGPPGAGPLTHTVSPCSEALPLIHVSTVTGKETCVDPPASCLDASLTLSIAALPPLSTAARRPAGPGGFSIGSTTNAGFPVWAQGWHYGSLWPLFSVLLAVPFTHKPQNIMWSSLLTSVPLSGRFRANVGTDSQNSCLIIRLEFGERGNQEAVRFPCRVSFDP